MLLDKPNGQWRKKLNKIRPTHHSKPASSVLLTYLCRIFKLKKKEKLDQDILYEEGMMIPPPSASLLFLQNKLLKMHQQACNMVTLLLRLSKACANVGGWSGWWCVSLEEREVYGVYRGVRHRDLQGQKKTCF